MRALVIALLALLGLTLLLYGVHQVYPPAALILAGAILIAAAADLLPRKAGG